MFNGCLLSPLIFPSESSPLPSPGIELTLFRYVIVPCVLEDICVWISGYYKPNLFSNHFYQCSYYDFAASIARFFPSSYFYFAPSKVESEEVLLSFNCRPLNIKLTVDNSISEKEIYFAFSQNTRAFKLWQYWSFWYLKGKLKILYGFELQVNIKISSGNFLKWFHLGSVDAYNRVLLYISKTIWLAFQYFLSPSEYMSSWRWMES